ncbi:hypothetical protein HXX76_014354 [Chlamydomonas incerta]|uniref:Agmatine deiminase n=1 Tax=Chlamydomonas incerta TaxID=51695 RepID=A0A835SCW0_CHLIN|nr:hypothetical protein HXX76_014354 [Chlamydomonas incerta]|eukprot:KAG2424629.1 hypothetical protein HXX76_014354 [Chlamydomonas incerta]
MAASAQLLRHAGALAARQRACWPWPWPRSSTSSFPSVGSAAAGAAAAHASQAAMALTQCFSSAAPRPGAVSAVGGSSSTCGGPGSGSSGLPPSAASARAFRSSASAAGSSSNNRIPLATDWLGSSNGDRGGSSNGSSSSARATPKARGFRMPGEWEPHAGTWMAFPHDRHLWRAAARPAQQQLAAVARAVSQFEQVWLLVDPQVRAEVRAALRGASGVELVEMRTNDVWTRDWGPTGLVRDVPGGGGGGRRRREVGALHFDYNCYGAPLKPHPLMPDWSLDRAAGRALPALAGLRAEHVWAAPAGLHLEGGAVLSDGEGTLLVTEECLLHPSRDLPPAGWRRWQQQPQQPDAGAMRLDAAVEGVAAQREAVRRLEREERKAAIGGLLCEYLGADKVLWLPHGMAGDEEGTNGHVDNVAAFAEPGVVLLAWCDSPDQDPDQTRLAAENLAALADQTDARGRKLRVVPVPCPLPVLKVSDEEAGGAAAAAAAAAAGYGKVAAGARLPASYINHYIVNGGVVVPLFGGEQRRSDDAALEVLTAAYAPSGRRVVGVDSREVLLGGGNVHCITQQLPAAE